MVSSYIKSAVAAVTLLAAGTIIANGAASAADDKAQSRARCRPTMRF